jgi:hypothetical protein
LKIIFYKFKCIGLTLKKQQLLKIVDMMTARNLEDEQWKAPSIPLQSFDLSDRLEEN